MASSWDDTAPSAVDTTFQADTSGGENGAWDPDDDGGFAAHGGISAANMSMHAAGDDAAGDSGCRICHQDGHFARNCPAKGPSLCKICNLEGHIATECTMNRIHAKMMTLGLAELNVDDAWAALVKADKEKDIDDIKEALLMYAKAYSEVTLEEIEAALRDSGMHTFLIAKQQEVSGSHTIVNLQGKTDQKYVVSFQFSAKPRRVKFAEGWPESAEENLARLSEAGFVMDSLVPKCSNCHEYGHTSKKCEQEKNEAAKVVISCANCDAKGHRARDCPQPRKSGKKGCRNCGGDHLAKDCDQPQNMNNVECKNCSKMGHFARDCPDRVPELCRNCGQEGHRKNDCTNERVMQCRNCDQWGHISRECPRPFDISKLKCTNCGNMGHSYKRCTEPPKEEAGGDDAAAPSTGGDWETGDHSVGAANSGGGGWETNDIPASAANDGW